MAMPEEVEFTSLEGDRIRGTLHRPGAESAHAVLMGHCFTCSRHTRILRQVCEDLAATGIMALRFDFSGNGQSGGNFSESSYTRHIGEMKTAMGFMAEQGANWFGLAGHSMGAAIALLTAAEEPNVRAVCGFAGQYTRIDPVDFLSRIEQDELRITGRVAFESRGRSLWLNESFFKDARRYDIPGSLKKLDRPVLLVHGDRDEITPVSQAYHGWELNPRAKLVIVDGADHMFLEEEHRRRVGRLVTDWFLEIISNPGGS